MLALHCRRWSSQCRLGLLGVPLLLATLLAGCDDNETTAPRASLANTGNGPNGKNAVVRVTPASDTLDALDGTLALAANVQVTWTSLSPTVVRVDETGHVVSVGPGLGLIQALGEGGRKADTAEILVRQLLASVQVTPDTLTLPLGAEDTLTAVAADANGFPILGALVTWVSDSVNIATVLEGILTAVDTGTAVIRAIVGEFADTARVTVVDPANPYP